MKFNPWISILCAVVLFFAGGVSEKLVREGETNSTLKANTEAVIELKLLMRTFPERVSVLEEQSRGLERRVGTLERRTGFGSTRRELTGDALATTDKPGDDQ